MTQFLGAKKKLPIVFRGHPSNFSVTPAEKLDLDPISVRLQAPVAAIRSIRLALLGINGHSNGQFVARYQLKKCMGKMPTNMGPECMFFLFEDVHKFQHLPVKINWHRIKENNSV